MLPRCLSVAVVLSAIPVFFFPAVPAFGQGFATGEFNGTAVDQTGGEGTVCQTGFSGNWRTAVAGWSG